MSASDAATSADPHALARSIVSENRFQQPELPRPLHGVLTAIGHALDKVFGPVANTLGGAAWVWALLAALAVAAALILAVRSTRRRRAASAATLHPSGATAAGDDPAALEHAADAAEARGDLAAAVRLRFRAGLLRLEHAEAIELRPGLTSGQIARRLGSQRFRTLAAAFDEVAYGGRAPERRDVDAARSGWREVIDEVSAA